MSSELARQRAAQAWCESDTEGIIIIPELAFAFADIIDEIWSKPWQSCAGTCGIGTKAGDINR